MHHLRNIIRHYRPLVMLLLALALGMKALVPAGFMVSPSKDLVLTVTICSSASPGLKQMQMAIPAKKHDGQQMQADGDTPCSFAGLGKLALGGIGPELLALALIFILALGFAPMRPPVLAQRHYIRPPLRGPPQII